MTTGRINQVAILPEAPTSISYTANYLAESEILLRTHASN
jgi:hypothetical protein